MLKIRPGTAEDAQIISDFQDRLCEYHESINEDHTHGAEPMRRITKDAGKYLLAFKDGVAVGMLKLTTTGGSSSISSFYVDDNVRGQGIGSALLNAAVNDSRERGSKYIRLVVKNKNTNAKKLYEKVGFKAGATVMYYELED